MTRPEHVRVALASNDSMTLLLQWAETQIDAAHAPVYTRGPLHGHTWFVRAARRVVGDVSDILEWHAHVEREANAFDHKTLAPTEALAEQLAAALGEALLADEVEVWRYVRGGRVGATWRRA